MTRLLVFSDTHGHTGAIRSLAACRPADTIIHLGDFCRDAQLLAAVTDGPAVVSVPGNCDFSSAPAIVTLCVEEVTLFLTHGHLHGVKRGTARLEQAARAARARVALFGHTHMPLHEERGGLLLINPGSLALPRAGAHTYALLEIDGKRVAAQIVPYL